MSNKTEFPKWLWVMLIALTGAAVGIIGFSAMLVMEYGTEDGKALFDSGMAVAFAIILAVAMMYIFGVIIFTRRTAVKS